MIIENEREQPKDFKYDYVGTNVRPEENQEFKTESRNFWKYIERSKNMR
jgi:hypothetical protein